MRSDPSSTKISTRMRAVREGVDELTLREGDAGTLRSASNTANVGASTWEPLFFDEDWHAICQAICQGVD